MEITQTLDRFKFISVITKSSIQFFFYFIRRVYKLFPIKDGNIIVVSLHKLGDSVFTIPAIREIQKYYKKKIIIVCFPESIPIFKQGVSEVLFSAIEHKDFYFNERIANFKARKILKSCNPEIIFNLNGVMTSATLVFASRARLIIGMSREQFKTINDIYIPENREHHLMDIYLDTISPLIPINNRELIKYFPQNDFKNKTILIHPFAGWKAKEWNLRKFIELGIILNEKYNVSIVAPSNIIGKDVVTEIEAAGITFLSTESVDDLIVQIKNCSVFIGNDSGPMHIADLLGKPTFSIYGPTNPKFVTPFGNHHSYCKSAIKCTPLEDEELCFTFGGRYGCPAFECMNALSVKSVEKEVLRFLDKIFHYKKLEPYKVVNCNL